MTIDFHCLQCRRLLRVADEHAGAQARCPQCGQVNSVPAAHEPVPPSASDPAPPGGNPFADLPQTAASTFNPYQSPHVDSYQDQRTAAWARSRVMAPAIALIVIGALWTISCGLILVAGAVTWATEGFAGDDIATFVVFAAFLLLNLVTIFGAVRMMMLRNYGLAVTAVVVSLATGLCCLLSLPFSIWALVVLVDLDVRQHFH